ncbi:MAG: hypothetical protein RMJ47_06275, partial [Bacteroidota bacterium]|nr:hypothetical protein [Bacteroidota bacterium]
MSSQTQLCSMLSVAALLFLGWGWSIGGQVPNGPTGVGSEAMLPLRATPDTSAQQPDVSSRTEQHSTLPSSTEAPALRAVVEDASERCPHGRRLLAEGPRGASTATLDASGSSPYFSAVSSGQNTGGDDKNAALGAYSVVCGGYGNTASGDYSTVGGGDGNTASKWYSTVGGGW